MKESQGRAQAGTWRQELKWRPWRRPAYWLVPMAHPGSLFFFKCNPRPPAQGQQHPQWAGNSHIDDQSRKCPTDSSTGQSEGGIFLNRSYFSPVVSSLCQVDKTRPNTTNQEDGIYISWTQICRTLSPCTLRFKYRQSNDLQYSPAKPAARTRTLHYCTYVVVKDLHQLLGPSVHVHGCAELLSHGSKTCKKLQSASWESSRASRGLHWPERGPTTSGCASDDLWVSGQALAMLHSIGLRSGEVIFSF